jgi:hypothetical protein
MTPNQLIAALKKLPEKVMDSCDVACSEGCDENGNAEFFTLQELRVVGDGSLDAAADGVLGEGSPVLLFGSDELQPPIFIGGMLRCCHSTILNPVKRMLPVGSKVICESCQTTIERGVLGWSAHIKPEILGSGPLETP